MIEVVYKGEAQEEQEGIALPKNVRQVGEIQRDRRIYIEDYVVTYIRQKIEENKNLGCVLILTGRKEYVQDTLYLFADGAFLVEYEQVGKDYLFSDRVWETVYEQVKEYFSGGEIVGWLLYDDDLTEERLLKAQKKNFPSEDMLLIKREAYEEDCTCYLYRNGSLDELPGYFVYYEKNEAMQEFLVKNYQNAARAAEEEQAIRKKEEPVVNFRKRMQKNREPRKRAGTGTHGILYAAGSFLLLLVIITGITMVNNYDKMQQFETAADLAGTLQNGDGAQQTSAAVASGNDGTGADGKNGMDGASGDAVGQAGDTNTADQANAGNGVGQNGNTGQASDTNGGASQGNGTGAQNGTGSQARVEEAPSGVTPLTDTASADSSTENGAGQNSNGTHAGNETAGQAGNQNGGNVSSGVETESSQNSGETGTGNENQEAGQGNGDAGAQSDSPMSAQTADATGGQTQDEAAAASTNVPVQYTVQPGDTLLAISKRVYGTDQMVGKICAANGINDGDKILAGQKILLP